MTVPRASSPDAGIPAFRRFNRLYTRVIGTLDEGLLRTSFSLAEVRVIYELAVDHEPSAARIAQALGMDPGYLSRILARFRRAGLVRRRPAKRDHRRAELFLTAKGRRTFQRLDTLSDRQAHGILGGLAPSERTQLIQAMNTIEGILAKDTAAPTAYVLRAHRPGDMGWVVHREGALYAEEYGWDGTFEALVARIVADFVDHFDPRRERCWIAEADGQPVGHVFLVRHPERKNTAKLRLLLVERPARGKGLGRLLVGECIRFARACGYRKITLWTQSMLLPAIRIYRDAGFRLVKEGPHRSFGADLIGQTWELDLAGDGGAASVSGANAIQQK